MHKIVVGLGFGDEGKGATVDWLCSTQKYGAVVRYNGGCQCGHNVVHGRGRSHTFSQFGSGTLRGVPTYLSEHMMVEPLALQNEAAHLRALVDFEPYSRLWIHPQALMTTPYHWELNKARERARQAPHGTVGRGIGETARYAAERPLYAPRMADLQSFPELERKLMELHDWTMVELYRIGQPPTLPSPKDLISRYRYMERGWHLSLSTDRFGPMIFEGGQGALLDQTWGFPPHNTWTDTTPANAIKMVGNDEFSVVGVMRTYHTRHGAGPFPTEAGGYPREKHNTDTGPQGPWRTGHLDLMMARFASRLAHQVNEIALTHMDALKRTATYCNSYATTRGTATDIPRTDPRALVPWLTTCKPNTFRVPASRIPDIIEGELGLRVTSLAYGPRPEDRKES